MRDYWVYMVLCDDASFYVGITNNVERRVAEHNLGDSPSSYTFMRRPVVLVHAAHFTDPESAIRYEKQLKGWSRSKKRALIDGDYEKIRLLAKSRSRLDLPGNAERHDPAYPKSPPYARPPAL